MNKKRIIITIVCVLVVGIILGGWIVIKDNNKIELTQTEYSVNYGTVFKNSDIQFSAHDKSVVPVMDDVSCDTIGNNTYSVQFENSKGKVLYTTEISIVTVDETAPTLEIKSVDVVQFDSVNLIDFVKATDNVDGDLTSKVVFSQTTIDTSAVGTQTVDITVSDNAGNKANGKLVMNITSRFIKVEYTKYSSASGGINVYSDYQLTTKIGTIAYREAISVINEVVGFPDSRQISWANSVAYISTSGVSDTQPAVPAPAPTPSKQPSTPSTTTTPSSTPSSTIDPDWNSDGYLGIGGNGGGTGSGAPTGITDGRAY